jgi:hypothetical protein
LVNHWCRQHVLAPNLAAISAASGLMVIGVYRGLFRGSRFQGF